MANRPPRDALPLKLLPRPGQKPPLYHYGFPYTRKYAIDYARRHHLTIPVADEDREAFGGRTILDMADLDDAWLEADKEIRLFAATISCTLMLDDLGHKCDFVLGGGRPFGKAWDRIVSLWSNYNVEERLQWCPDYEKVIDTLKNVMNETEEHKYLDAQWWFDWDNNVVRRYSVNEFGGG